MGDFGVDTQLANVEIGEQSSTATATISEDWAIWGPNGGYIASICLRAAGAHSPFHRPVSYSGHFLRVPDFADVELKMRTLNRTRRAESIQVSMSQGGKPMHEAMVWIADTRDGLVHDTIEAPTVDDPADMPTGRELFEASGAENTRPPFKFWDNLEQRPVDWMPPDAWETREPGEARSLCWYKYLPTATFDDAFLEAARSMLLIDTMGWPATVRAYRPSELLYIAPSLDIYTSFHRLSPESDYLLCDNTAPVGHDGLIGGRATVWNEKRELVASGGASLICRPAPPMG